MKKDLRPHLRNNRYAPFQKWCILVSLLALTGSGSRALAMPQNEVVAPQSNSVTTGNTVAATTFTEAVPAFPDGAALLSPGTGADEMIAQNINGHFEVASFNPTPTYSEGFGTAASAYDHLYSSTVTAENMALSGRPEPVPEPGVLVTVVSLGFTTGVALLRGQTRTASRRLA